jgi:predicted lipase
MMTDTLVVFVGFDPNLNTVVVAHQGTNMTHVESVIVDLELIHGPLDPNLFPGLSRDIEVHCGFQNAHARSAQQILQAVKQELSMRGTDDVLIVGHSLGGALALLDGIFLGQNLPATTQVKVVTYGMPRVSPNHRGYQ